MKNILIKCSLVLSFMFAVQSCDKNALTDLNQNPNAVTDIDMSYLMTLATL